MLSVIPLEGGAESMSDSAFLEAAKQYSLMSLVERSPDASNRLDLDLKAIAFGEALFFDAALSSTGEVSCSTCHDANNNEGSKVNTVRESRSIMSIEGAGYQHFFNWDGRADSLWMQALEPLENDNEHDMTRSEIAAYIIKNYKEELQTIAPDLYVRSLSARAASPIGNKKERQEWNNLSSSEQLLINNIFVIVGKAIAAFVGSIPVRETRWDKIIDMAARDLSALSNLTESERAGFELFIGKARCGTCHHGPLFTDLDFHNTALPQKKTPIDLGRQSVLLDLLQSPFNCLGQFSDAVLDECDELTYINLSMDRSMGAFKTPTLRGIMRKKHFGHAGQISSINELIFHYNKAPIGPHGRLIGVQSLSELIPLGLTAGEIDQLISFLDTISD